MIENVLTEITHKQIIKAVVIVISDTHALAPAVVNESDLRRHVGKRAVTIILEEMRGGLLARRKSLEAPAVHEKDIEPAVVVVIVKGDSTAGSFKQIFVFVLAAIDCYGVQPCGPPDIDEAGPQRLAFFTGILRNYEPIGARWDQPKNALQWQDQR